MSASPIASWEGAGAVFTFGPESVGMWIILTITFAVVVGVVARMIIHENRTFNAVKPDLIEGGAMKGTNI